MLDDYSEDEDSFAGIVLSYLYEPSDSQAFFKLSWYEHK